MSVRVDARGRRIYTKIIDTKRPCAPWWWARNTSSSNNVQWVVTVPILAVLRAFQGAFVRSMAHAGVKG
jgi:hypothetical protein